MWENQTHVQLNQVEGQEPAAAPAKVAETITEEPEAEAQVNAEPQPSETVVCNVLMALLFYLILVQV